MKKGIVFEVGKFSTHDGPGIRTVLFLKGCPLRCMWCHSPESWSYKIEKYPNGETIGREMTVEEAVEEGAKDADFYEASGGGVTLSGGEALAQAEFAYGVLKGLKARGIHTAVETSGYAERAVVERMLGVVDTWLWDVKELDAKKHMEYTGRGLGKILGNLKAVDAALKAGGKGKGRIVLRCPMIPGVNDGDSELAAIGKLADELDCVEELHVIPYIPYGIDKAKRLGLKVWEGETPPPEYAEGKTRRLAELTRKRVVKK